MKKYDSYKDSGDVHIGLIPSDWNSSRVKYIGEIIGRIGFRGYTVADIVHDGDGAIALSPSNIKNQSLTLKDSTYISWEKYEESPEIKIYDKDIIIVKTGSTIGKIAFVNVSEKLTLNPQLVVLKNIKIDNKFFYYAAISNFFQHFFTMNSAGGSTPAISQEKINNFSLAHPKNQNEQTQIANYLDHKTTQIDDLISNKEKLIELLKEERTAIINQAVTKGLDPNVPMMDSGIEWLGEIPEHWERIRIKTLVAIKVTDGPHETPEWTLEGIPFLSAESIKGNQLDFNFKRGYISIEQHEEYCKKSKVEFGDILFCKSGSTTGKSALVDTDAEFGIWSPLAIIRADKNKIDNHYLFQSIQSDFFRRQVETSWTFGTQPNIGMGAIENLWIAVPTIDEQFHIAKYVREEIERFDDILNKLSLEIELLKEYKTSLISEVVTGKVDVRDEVVTNNL